MLLHHTHGHLLAGSAEIVEGFTHLLLCDECSLALRLPAQAGSGRIATHLISCYFWSTSEIQKRSLFRVFLALNWLSKTEITPMGSASQVAIATTQRIRVELANARKELLLTENYAGEFDLPFRSPAPQDYWQERIQLFVNQQEKIILENKK